MTVEWICGVALQLFRTNMLLERSADAGREYDPDFMLSGPPLFEPLQITMHFCLLFFHLIKRFRYHFRRIMSLEITPEPVRLQTRVSLEKLYRISSVLVHESVSIRATNCSNIWHSRKDVIYSRIACLLLDTSTSRDSLYCKHKLSFRWGCFS